MSAMENLLELKYMFLSAGSYKTHSKDVKRTAKFSSLSLEKNGCHTRQMSKEKKLNNIIVYNILLFKMNSWIQNNFLNSKIFLQKWNHIHQFVLN